MQDSGEARSRGALLTRQAERVGALRRVGWAPGAAGAVSGWSLLALLACFLADPDIATSPVFVLVAAALVAVVAWRLGLAVHRSRSRRRELARWRLVDRTPAARSLPAHDLVPDLRTPFDARDDADLAQVGAGASVAGEASVRDLRMVWFGLALVPAVMVLILLVGLAATVPEAAPRVVAVVAAVVVGTALLDLYCGWQAELWRRQQAWTGHDLETRIWLVRQSLLAQEPTVLPQPPRAAVRAALALSMVVLPALLLDRWREAAVVVVVLAVAVLLAALPSLLRRGRTRLLPLLHGGTDLLSAPGRPAVEVAVAPDGIEVRHEHWPPVRVPRSDVLGVVRLWTGHAFEPTCVGVVRRDGPPLALTGPGAQDLLAWS